MPNSTTTARRALEARISELDKEQNRLNDERQKLQEALTVLGTGTSSQAQGQRRARTSNGRRTASGGTSTATARRGRPRKQSGGSGRGRKRIPREQRVQALLDAAKANPEATNAELARELGVTGSYVSTLIKELGKEKKLRRDKRNRKLVVSS